MSETRSEVRNARGATTNVVATRSGSDQAEVRGTVRVAPGVLIALIELTVTDIHGVAGLRSRRKRQRQSADPGIGKSYENGKVLVSVDGNQIGADVAVAIYRGTNVSELSADIQRKVGIVVGNMLGMTVQTVNIYIEDIISSPDQA